jgi:hypothetical protein
MIKRESRTCSGASRDLHHCLRDAVILITTRADGKASLAVVRHVLRGGCKATVPLGRGLMFITPKQPKERTVTLAQGEAAPEDRAGVFVVWSVLLGIEAHCRQVRLEA